MALHSPNRAMFNAQRQTGPSPPVAARNARNRAAPSPNRVMSHVGVTDSPPPSQQQTGGERDALKVLNGERALKA